MLKRKMWFVTFCILLVSIVFLYVAEFEIAYLPPEEKIINNKGATMLTGLANTHRTGKLLLHEDILPIDESYLELKTTASYKKATKLRTRRAGF
ncbi:hypothetical protein DS745_13175 [Anaerobacillus alkaliphilus]|uniref:Uncharacterized protein n=1 Tax=Anaerobacillus alkaliphilus TaxID=1548597 RepID=A0A4Q0VR41_9BACI|nr:hypothetical protein [Anaerobacillus alkaliphilus]RXI99829.1 hypothetical protein DS745_13175 [Anaerobacillus alkaliphilus]